ncbi:hypothetical protein M9435_004992 [Picochlorum sp. BPE23]|jgi:predicted SAM-dependent methyltransferase|nr:hypothetical protein M9435_004992 [Picochlorum sp. BPE23]
MLGGYSKTEQHMHPGNAAVDISVRAGTADAQNAAAGMMSQKQQIELILRSCMEPMEINVACENPECASLLRVMVPESVHRLAPPSLVIRCAGCGKLLSVSLPAETYIQHRTKQLQMMQEKQDQLKQLQLLEQEIQQKRKFLEEQMKSFQANTVEEKDTNRQSGSHRAEDMQDQEEALVTPVLQRGLKPSESPESA